MKLLGRPVRFGDVPTADIVIVDRTGSQFVRSAVNPRHRVAIVDLRPSEIRIGPRVIAAFARGLSGFRFGDVDRSRGTLRGVVRELWHFYMKAMVSAIRPKVVLTFIDNSPVFHWLSRHAGNVPHAAIQNGTRLRSHVVPGSGYFLQHLFSFGEHEQAVFPEFGYEVKAYHPVGSLVASLHFKEKNPGPPIDLLVVSTWRGNIGFTSEVQDTMRSMRIMDELLSEYLRVHRLTAAVILRAERGGEHWRIPELGKNEEEYYRGIYGDRIEIIDTDFKERNIFPLMQRSRVIVSCLSSALVEAYGIGKKVLYCNFSGTDLHHADLTNDILTSDSDRNAFFGRLDDLLAMPEAEYRAKHQARQRYYMTYPDSRPTYAEIADQVEQLIASAGAA